MDFTEGEGLHHLVSGAAEADGADAVRIGEAVGDEW